MIISRIVTQLSKTVPYLVIFCLMLSLILPPSHLHADNPNRLYISPPSSQLNIGSSITVNIRSYADSDQTNGTAVGSITYPSNLLQVASTSVSGSSYGSPSISVGNGTIGFNGSRKPAPSGTQQIFAVTFNAIAAGTATVNFGSESKVNNITTNYSGGVYTIINPNPVTSPQPSTPTKTTAPVQQSPVPVSSAPTPTDTTTAPSEDSGVTLDTTGLTTNVVVNPAYTSATVTWQVAASSPTTELLYGSSTSQLDKKTTVTKTADGSYLASINSLEPGLRYYFAINSSGNGKDGTYKGSIITKGYPITITITENNATADKAQVKIGSQSYTTASNGKLSIGLAAGDYSGTVTTDTASLPISLTVAKKTIPTDGSDPDSQSFAFNLTSSPLEQGPGSGLSLFSFIGILIVGALVFGVAFAVFIAYRRRRFETDNDEVQRFSGSPTVIIDDGYDWREERKKTNQMPSISETGDRPGPSQESTLSQDDSLQNPNPPHSTKP